MKKALIALALITNTANADLPPETHDMLNQVANMLAKEAPKQIDRGTVMVGITYSSGTDTLTYRMMVDRKEIHAAYEQGYGTKLTEAAMEKLLPDLLKTESIKYACNGLDTLDTIFRKQQIYGVRENLRIKYIYVVGSNFHEYLVTANICNDLSIGEVPVNRVLSEKSKAEIPPVTVVSTVQDSEGLTESYFNIEGLNQLEKWQISTAKSKALVSFSEAGFDPKDFKFIPKSNSGFITVGGKKFAIIKLSVFADENDRKPFFRAVRIVGFIPEGMATVGCMRESHHDILVWSGKCGNTIQEVFGVSMRTN